MYERARAQTSVESFEAPHDENLIESSKSDDAEKQGQQNSFQDSKHSNRNVGDEHHETHDVIEAPAITSTTITMTSA
jgi:hypothetical protein